LHVDAFSITAIDISCRQLPAAAFFRHYFDMITPPFLRLITFIATPHYDDAIDAASHY
jgi:hypothetical protein